MLNCLVLCRNTAGCNGCSQVERSNSIQVLSNWSWRNSAGLAKSYEWFTWYVQPCTFLEAPYWMSEIECAQLHSELFRRRHSTRQSLGLFALAKHLFTVRASMLVQSWESYFCLSVLWQNWTMHCRYFLPPERAITVVFWHQQWLVGDGPFHLKFALKVTLPLLKDADFDRFPRITSQL